MRARRFSRKSTVPSARTRQRKRCAAHGATRGLPAGAAAAAARIREPFQNAPPRQLLGGRANPLRVAALARVRLWSRPDATRASKTSTFCEF